jgi:DNA-binding response OmpR family regulator
MKPHILIIEDEPDIAESIRYNVERNGEFTAQVAHDSQAALRILYGKAITSQPQPPVTLILLDVNLPDMNGFELCRRFRAEAATRQTPILMLTARVEEADKVKGLDAGADDYVTKPFSVRELVARVKALLRRSGYQNEAPQIYEDDQLRVDYGGFQVLCEGVEIKLTRKEFALLALLTRNQARVIPRERLLDEVWGMQYYGDARTLDVHISGLRKKLSNCGARIETVIGIGYRFRSYEESETLET